MIEFFALMKTLKTEEGFSDNYMNLNIPLSWILVSFIIAFGAAFISYNCNKFETPATRALSTIFAFFFSYIYNFFSSINN